jgi:ketosteroid isomerase-like protein
MRALCAPGVVFEDRQRLSRVSGDRELMIASMRERVLTGARPEARVIGVVGDRIVLVRMLWTGGPADGRFEIEYLSLSEVDASGSIVACILFDPDDTRGAQREAWARWAAIDPASAALTTPSGEGIDAFNDHDRARFRATFADDLVLEDHRHAGLGRLSVDGYVDSVAMLWELASESRLDGGWLWPAVERHGAITVNRSYGILADGGAYEREFLWLFTVARGRVTRGEMFEPEDLDVAVGRLAELRPDPLRIPPNEVTRTWDRWLDALVTGDRDTIAAMYDPSYRFDDRRPLFRLTVRVDATVDNDLFILDEGLRPTRTLLATAGNRLALQHILWTKGEADAPSEVEILMVTEVAPDGRFVFGAVFDPGDRAAAFTELRARHLRSTRPAAHRQFLEFQDFRHDDLVRFRAAFPDDYFFRDHRRTGLGCLEDADSYVASVVALNELSPDALPGQPLYYLADEPHASLSIAHTFGTLADGGQFESVYAMIMVYGRDGLIGVELFELDDLDAAKARFEALRPTPHD